jgi:hypothetical protein
MRASAARPRFSDYDTAVPTRSVMNSRRLMGKIPLPTLSIKLRLSQEVCVESRARLLTWVKSGHDGADWQCLLYPPEADIKRL